MDPLTKHLKNIPTYDLGDVYLRPIQESDVLDLYEYGSDEKVTKYLSWGPMKDPKEATHVIHNVFLCRPENGVPAAHAIIEKDSNKMIGTCDFPEVNWSKKSASLGYVLHSDYWGRGYMSKIVKVVLGFGFHYLGLNTIYVQHLHQNIGSRKVILRNGFRYIDERYNEKLDLMLPTYKITKGEFHQ